MNTLPRSLDISQSSHSTAFEQALSPEVLRESVPAAFAPSAHERLSASYGFVPTAQVLDALRQAGFRPVEARQTRTRIASPLHARHLIRLRRHVETIGVGDATPELLLLNSHDGTSAYLMLTSGCNHLPQIVEKIRPHPTADSNSPSMVTDDPGLAEVCELAYDAPRCVRLAPNVGAGGWMQSSTSSRVALLRPSNWQETP